MALSLYCRQCGARLTEKSAFCPTCGASQSPTNHHPTSAPQADAINAGTGRIPAGQTLHQRYRILQRVGQGGMGAVYVAQDTQLGDRLVAVKEMSMSRLAPQDLSQAVEQFRREAHLLASLHHPNLPIIYEYFNVDDRWYLVMSFIEGGTLQSALETAPSRRLPTNDVVRIGLDLCTVLNYLHTNQPQVIFRDLKPANIMITPKGTVYLIDFGIARHFKQEQSKDTAYYYSVGYAPPEQYGQSQTSPRSDIYSLGATLHQMLSGHNPSSRPFQFPSLQLIDPTIPTDLALLIAQMLEMNEQQRPANMAEVKARLEKIQPSTPLPSTIQAGSVEDVEARNKAHQKETVSSTETPIAPITIEQGTLHFWNKLDNFLSKRRVLAWLCLAVFSLAMIWPAGWHIFNYDQNTYSLNLWQSAGIALLSAGIGTAIVSLLSLPARGRATLPRGIALTCLGYCAFLAFLSSGIYSDITETTDNHTWITVWGSIFHSFIPLVLLFSALLLLIGTRLVLYSSTTPKVRIAFGILLIIMGMVVAFFVQNKLDSWYANYFYSLWTSSYNASFYRPSIPLTLLLWIFSTVLGFNAIFFTRAPKSKSSTQAA